MWRCIWVSPCTCIVVFCFDEKQHISRCRGPPSFIIKIKTNLIMKGKRIMKTNDIERDELRGRFTVWLETLVSRAKIDYCRRNKNNIEFIPIDELSEECLAVEDPIYISPEQQQEFEFEEERLAKAFADLPKMRREILTLLYVRQRAPQEIADELGCTLQHVYNQHSKALKTLKTKLTGGDE